MDPMKEMRDKAASTAMQLETARATFRRLQDKKYSGRGGKWNDLTPEEDAELNDALALMKEYGDKLYESFGDSQTDAIRMGRSPQYSLEREGTLSDGSPRGVANYWAQQARHAEGLKSGGQEPTE